MGDRVQVDNWDSGTQYQVESILAGDGRILLSSQVDLLIQDMATFSQNNGGIAWEDALTQMPDETRAVLAVHWQPATV